MIDKEFIKDKNSTIKTNKNEKNKIYNLHEIGKVTKTTLGRGGPNWENSRENFSQL